MSQVPAVDRYLEKPGAGSGRGSRSGRGTSPARSPVASGELHNHRKDLGDDHVQPFRVNLKQEKKSKFSSLVLKMRGIDQVRDFSDVVDAYSLLSASCL